MYNPNSGNWSRRYQSLSIFHPIMAVLGLNHSIYSMEGEFSYQAIIAENNTLHDLCLESKKHCLSAVNGCSIKMWRKVFYEKSTRSVGDYDDTGHGNAVAQQLTYPTKNIDVVIPKKPGRWYWYWHVLSLICKMSYQRDVFSFLWISLL